MNQVLVANLAPMMTSRQIAELVESRHDDVKRSIKRLADKGVIGVPPLADYLDTLGRTATEYQICKRDSYVIVAQLSPEFTARLVDRWQELESGAAHNRQLSTLEILEIATNSERERVRLEAELKIAAPAREFVDRYVDSTGTKGFREVCKLLKANENEFRAFLSDRKIMYKLGGDWTAHAEHLDAGRFVVRAGTSQVSGHAYNSARFTPKGVTWIAGEWAKFQIQGEL